MIFVRNAPEWDYGWLVERADFSPTTDFRAIEAINERDGKIVGMVGYCNWLPNSVELHVAIARPALCRALLRPMFSYPFVDSGRRILIANIASDNERSLNTAWHLGFKLVGKVQDGVSPGVDICRHELRREDCRYIMAHERKAA